MAGCDVTIGVCADGKGARKELDDTGKKAQSFSQGLVKSFKQIALTAGITFGAAQAVRMFKDFMVSSVKAYIEQEASLTKLAAVLRSTGNEYGFTVKELHDFSTQMQRTTMYSDTAIDSAQALMLTFTKVGREVFPDAITAAADLSAALGQDLQSSVIQIGKALNDPITGVTALRRVGVSFTQSQTEMIKKLAETGNLLGAQTLIMRELQTEFGGMAKAMGDTLQGRIAKIKNAFDDIKKIIGALISGPLLKVTEQILEFTKNEAAIQTIVTALRSLGLIFMTVFRIMFATIKSTLLQYKMLADAIMDVGRLIKIVFDPSNWRLGAMKKAFSDFKWTVVEDVKDIAEIWKGVAEKTVIQFNKILAGGIPEIKAAISTVRTVASDAIDPMVAHALAVNKMALEMSKLDPIARATAEAMSAYGSAVNDAIGDTVAEMDRVDPVARATAEAMASYGSSANKVTKTLEEQKAKYQEIAGYVGDFFNILGSASSTSYANQRADLDEWYLKQRETIDNTITNEEEKRHAIEALDNEMALKEKKLQTDEAKAKKKFAIFDILIDTARGIAESFPSPFKMAWIAAMGAAQLAIVASQKIPSYARGGDFITQGPQVIMVGDNPSGRERVSVTPSEAAPMQQSIVITGDVILDGYKVGVWFSRESRAKNIRTYRGSIVD